MSIEGVSDELRDRLRRAIDEGDRAVEFECFEWLERICADHLSQTLHDTFVHSRYLQLALIGYPVRGGTFFTHHPYRFVMSELRAERAEEERTRRGLELIEKREKEERERRRALALQRRRRERSGVELLSSDEESGGEEEKALRHKASWPLKTAPKEDSFHGKLMRQASKLALRRKSSASNLLTPPHHSLFSRGAVA